jgi:hypothetical protein
MTDSSKQRNRCNKKISELVAKVKARVQDYNELVRETNKWCASNEMAAAREEDGDLGGLGVDDASGQHSSVQRILEADPDHVIKGQFPWLEADITGG